MKRAARPLCHAFPLALAGALVLAACARRPDDAAKPAAAPAPDPRVQALERRIHELYGEIAQLRSLLEEARAKQAAAEARLAAVPTNASPLLARTGEGFTVATNNPLGQVLQAVSGVLTNPVAMRTLRDNLGAWGRMQGHVHDDFLAGLSLSDTQRREFDRLVRMRRNAAMSARWMGEQEGARMAAEAEAGLRSLLGAHYADLETYEKDLPARLFADRFNLYLQDRQLAMEPAHKAQFVAALAALPGMSTDHPGASDGAERPRDVGAALDRQLDQTVENFDRIVAAAKPVLSAEENHALDSFLGEQLQQREVGASVTRAIVSPLLGTGVPPAAAAATNAAPAPAPATP